ncbi:hypothetical protein PAMP_013877 [Pampus punctatissimus]
MKNQGKEKLVGENRRDRRHTRCPSGLQSFSLDGDRKTKADCPLNVKPGLQSTASLKVSCWPVDQPERWRAVTGGCLNGQREGGDEPPRAQSFFSDLQK